MDIVYVQLSCNASIIFLIYTYLIAYLDLDKSWKWICILRSKIFNHFTKKHCSTILKCSGLTATFFAIHYIRLKHQISWALHILTTLVSVITMTSWSWWLLHFHSWMTKKRRPSNIMYKRSISTLQKSVVYTYTYTLQDLIVYTFDFTIRFSNLNPQFTFLHSYGFFYN